MHGEATNGVMAHDERWLIFRAPQRGQGIGSMMRGVAAALSLGERHDRRVCIHWPAFQQAFTNDDGCPPKSDYFTTSSTSGTAILNGELVFDLWSFGDGVGSRAPIALLSGERRIVVMQGDGGNEAPSGPLNFPFRIQPALARLLPTETARAVAHLRVGDPHEPGRRGLFASEPLKITMSLLAANLPADILVLTDSEAVVRALCDRGVRAQVDGGRGSFMCATWGVQPHRRGDRAARCVEITRSHQELK